MNQKFINVLFLFSLCLTCINTASAQEEPKDPQVPDVTLGDQASAIRSKILSGPPGFTLVGEIERSSKGDYSINGENFVIDSDARINGDLAIGKQAEIRGHRIGGINYAKKIIVSSKTESPNSRSTTQSTEL